MYFKEIVLDKNNKFTLDIFQTNQIYEVHFSPKKDYFITSMNCNLDIQEDIKNSVFDEIKELLEKSRLLLEKGPVYQNDIKRVYMWLGVPGRAHEKIYFYFVLSAANINIYSWHYKFYDVEEKKIRDCRIYSPYEHFLKRGFIFKNDTFTSASLYSVGVNEYMDQVTTNFMYKRYLFDFDNSYRERSLFFVFDKEKDEYIDSDPDYHFIANDKYMRFGDQVPEIKKFLLDYYTLLKPQNKTVILFNKFAI